MKKSPDTRDEPRELDTGDVVERLGVGGLASGEPDLLMSLIPLRNYYFATHSLKWLDRNFFRFWFLTCQNILDSSSISNYILVVRPN